MSAVDERFAANRMTICEIEDFLDDAPGMYLSGAERLDVAQALANIKNVARGANDEHGANQVWCLEQVLQAQNHFVLAFAHCKLREFYAGWCEFHRAELTLQYLKPHIFSKRSRFSLEFMERQVAAFQSLYSYNIFISAGILVNERVCSICGMRIGLLAACHHRGGELYGGEMCCHVITRSEVLEISFIDDPVDKSCVPFMTDPAGKTIDQHNYAILDYVTGGLRSPFNGWSRRETLRRIPHTKFNQIGRNDPCPCHSGSKYKKCCLPKPVVEIKHCDVRFEVDPPAGFPPFVEVGAQVSGRLERDAKISSIWTDISPAPSPPTTNSTSDTKVGKFFTSKIL